MFASKILLFPYYLTLKIRNYLYDSKLKDSCSYDIPVISVGNVNAGGTGKTPTVELIVSLLKDDYRVAVVSRGYRRNSHGFLYVGIDDDADKVGDEPLQIKRKFPSVTVVVDKDRKHAIDTLLLLNEEERPQVIIMDDSFQYRSVVPAKSIVLIDYKHPIFRDELLPFGRLRDLPEQIRRADVVIITKVTEDLNQWEREKIIRINRIRKDQKVFFARTAYSEALPVFDEFGNRRYKYSRDVALFTGIADDKPIILYLSGKYDNISHMSYGDHHKFTRFDMTQIKDFARNHPRTLLLTTEKDAQRLIHNKWLNNDVRTRMFYLPIRTEFLTNEDYFEFYEFILKGLPEVAQEPKGNGTLLELIKEGETGFPMDVNFKLADEKEPVLDFLYEEEEDIDARTSENEEEQGDEGSASSKKRRSKKNKKQQEESTDFLLF